MKNYTEKEIEELAASVRTVKANDTEAQRRQANELLELGRRMSNNRYLGIAYYRLGMLEYENASNIEIVTSYFFRTIDRLHEEPEYTILTGCYSMLGNIFMSQGAKSIAFDYFMNALDIAEQSDDSSWLCGITYGILADLSHTIDNNEQALDYINRSIALMESCTDRPYYANNMMNSYVIAGKLELLCHGNIQAAKQNAELAEKLIPQDQFDFWMNPYICKVLRVMIADHEKDESSFIANADDVISMIVSHSLTSEVTDELFEVLEMLIRHGDKERCEKLIRFVDTQIAKLPDAVYLDYLRQRIAFDRFINDRDALIQDLERYFVLHHNVRAEENRDLLLTMNMHAEANSTGKYKTAERSDGGSTNRYL